jgi:hypothetical protein
MADDLVEIALLTARRGFLVHQSEFLALELLEEFFPGDFLQRAGTAVTGKIDPQHSRIVAFAARAFHDCGAPAAGFGH